jgi:chaperonin cofactor prefoldin
MDEMLHNQIILSVQQEIEDVEEDDPIFILIGG